MTIERLLIHIVYTNIIVAISTASLCAGFTYRIGIDHWYYYGFFGFSSTFAVYNGQRLIKSATQKETPWLNWVRKHQRVLYLWVIAMSLGSLCSLLLIGQFNWKSLVLIAAAGLISLFYIVPIKGRNLRELAYVKIHLIAITWTVVLIAFPIVSEEQPIGNLVWVIFAHYLYILAVTIPFDIRDLKYDSKLQKTLPQLMGVAGSKGLAVICLAAFAGIMLWQMNSLGSNIIFYLAIAVQFLFIILMKESRGDLYCAGGIDGAISLLGISYFLLQ